MTLGNGELLHNRYRIQQTIAAGGMGSVYRALDETLGVTVAVKENFFSTEESARQFRREATILAGLKHPNLPRVTDHFIIHGQGQYLVMDFIEGIDLRQIISQRGVLPESEVVRIGSIICDALEYLHSRSPAIVHRDIKPGNLKIAPSGQVFLVDFGLAKLAQGEATMTGAQALTPGYAPPEQYGQGTNPLSDIYGLGATLYAALTGRVPEDGLSRMVGSARLVPVQQANPQVSEWVAQVIERSMALRPADRFPNARAFKQALAGPQPFQPGYTQEQPATQPAGRFSAPTVVDRPAAAAHMSGPPQARPIRSALPAVLGIGAVVALGGLAALIFGSGLAQSLLAPAPIPTSTATITLTAAPTFTIIPSVTPTTNPSPTATEQPTLTPAPTETEAPPPTVTLPPAATPAGGGPGQIAFASGQNGSVQVWIMNSDGSDPRQVTNMPDGACQPAWSPDGKRLVFISPCAKWADDYPGASLYLANADGTGLVPLASQPGGDYDPAWSPDGSTIAFTSLREGSAHIFLYQLDANSAARISSPVNVDRRPAWSPDGSTIAYETNRLGQPQIWVMAADGSNARGFSSLSGGIDYMPAWAPDGSMIIFNQGHQHFLISRQLRGSQGLEIKITEKFYPVEDARFSPDGFWIACQSKQSGNMDIYRLLKGGGSLTRLTNGPGEDFQPAWRPALSP